MCLQLLTVEKMQHCFIKNTNQTLSLLTCKCQNMMDIMWVETIKDLNPDAKLVVVTGNLDAGDSDLFDLLHVPIIAKPFDTHKIKQIIIDVFLDKNYPVAPFEIRYKFKDDINSYTCTVTYPQYRNLKELPVIEECKIVDTKKNVQLYQDEMQRALELVVQNDTSHIRKLSEIVQD